MAAGLESHQFLFVILLVFVVSGALRVGLEVWRREGGGELQVFNRLSLPNIRMHSQSRRLQEANQVKARGLGLPGSNISWCLPPSLARSFPGPGGSRAMIDPAQFRLHIKVLTFDRTESLMQTLASLEGALYDGDSVSLSIFVDHPVNHAGGKWGPKTAERTRLTHALLRRVDNFTWPHGEKRVHYRSQNAGIQPQWLEAWWPESVNDFAFVVEDDMQVSPVYYRYFKQLAATYYFNASNFDPRVYGISFQRQAFVPGVGGNPIVRRGVPFLYQLVGTWGQILFPAPWKDFRTWYDMRRYNESCHPAIAGLKTTQWWFNKGNKLWTPWIIKWAHARHMYNLYTSFPGNLSLTTSLRPIGSNFHHNRGADAALMSEKHFGDPSKSWWVMPPMRLLRRHDLCFSPVPRGAVGNSLQHLHSILNTQHFLKEKAVAFVVIPAGSYDLASNWLCHLEGLNVRNIILMSFSVNEANELAGNGHFVLHIATPTGMNISAIQAGTNIWLRQHLQMASLALTLGYRVLLCNVDVIWHADPQQSLAGPGYDIAGVLYARHLSSSFLYFSHSPGTVAALAALSDAWPDSTQRLSERKSQELSSILLGEDLNFRTIITSPLVAFEDMQVVPGVVPVVLSPPNTSKEQKVRRLASAGLWIIDDHDLACKSVTCRKRKPSS